MIYRQNVLSDRMTIMELLKTLVDTNSHSDNPKGLKRVATLLEKAFARLEGQNKRVGMSLLFKKRPEAPIQLFFGGHFDTVYPQDCPFQKCSKISAKRWQGPGIADMKGGLTILLESLIAFEKSPQAKNIGWRIVLNHDEETGSLQSRPLIEKMARGCQAAFFFEPSAPNGDLVSSRKGSLNGLLISRGKTAHAGRDLASGINAIVPLAELIYRLKDFPGLNFGQITGGQAYNVVPDYAELKFNLRSEKEACFKPFIECIEKSGLEWHLVSFRPPKPYDAKTKKLFRLLNYPGELISSGGVCDGNFTAALGIPTVDTLGAVGGNIHTYEEYIEVDRLKERQELFFNFLIRLSKGEFTLC